MKKESINNQRKPATPGTSSITAETQVKDILPQGLLEDIRSLQAIRDRLDKYMEKKKADETMWDTFTRDAESAWEHIGNAIYDLSAIAGRELDYKIMNL